MVAYHGSNEYFDNFIISKNLSKSNASELNEGLGIYFSLKQEVAESYGEYIYTLKINDKYIKDFRVKSECKRYVIDLIRDIYNEKDVDISTYFNIDSLVEYIHSGNIAVSGIGREITLLLDSNENWYINLDESKIEDVYKILDNYDENNLDAYLFNYNIEDIGIIKNIDSDIVEIIDRNEI